MTWEICFNLFYCISLFFLSTVPLNAVLVMGCLPPPIEGWGGSTFMSALEQSVHPFPEMHTTRPSAASAGSTEAREEKPVLKRLQTNHVLQGQTCMSVGICDCKTAGPGNNLSEGRRLLTWLLLTAYLTWQLPWTSKLGSERAHLPSKKALSTELLNTLLENTFSLCSKIQNQQVYILHILLHFKIVFIYPIKIYI